MDNNIKNISRIYFAFLRIIIQMKRSTEERCKIYKYISTNFIDLPPCLVTPINCLYRGCGFHLGFAGVRLPLFRFHRELTSRRVLLLRGKYEIRLALLLAPANIRRVLLAPALVIQFIDILEGGKRQEICLEKISLPYEKGDLSCYR